MLMRPEGIQLMHFFVCMHAQREYTCMCVCRAQKISGIISQVLTLVYFSFKDKISHLLVRLDWLASKPQGFLLSPPSQHWGNREMLLCTSLYVDSGDMKSG